MSERGLATAQSRVQALQQKHAILSSRIHEAHNHPSSTDFYLRQLKKERLLIKEALEEMRRKTATN
ncbi:MAG: DUF465 domain-containing protein [Alphaproteobacteria bacterium]|nr:DUF465 domain-containing protein [Alphaproteobacteria bacterium]